MAERRGRGGHARKNGFWAHATPKPGISGAAGAAASGRPKMRARGALLARNQPTGHVPASLQSRGVRGCLQGAPKNRGLGPKQAPDRGVLQPVAAFAAPTCPALALGRIFEARNFFLIFWHRSRAPVCQSRLANPPTKDGRAGWRWRARGDSAQPVRLRAACAKAGSHGRYLPGTMSAQRPDYSPPVCESAVLVGADGPWGRPARPACH